MELKEWIYGKRRTEKARKGKTVKALILCLILSTFLIVSIVFGFIQPVKAVNSYKLHVVGTHLENENNETVYLRSSQISWNERSKKQGENSMADSPSEAWFTSADLTTIKSYNSNCIEIHQIPFKYVMKYKDVLNTEYFVDWCDVWVNWATTKEMYVILDIATFTTIASAQWKIPDWLWSSNYSTPQDKEDWDTIFRDFFDTDEPKMSGSRASYITAWEGIANRYKNNDYVLFSIHNEPLCGVSMINEATSNHLAECYPKFMEDVVDGIHSTGAENIIIINRPYVWYYNVKPVNKDGIMWEDHKYIGWSYDYEGWVNGLTLTLTSL